MAKTRQKLYGAGAACLAPRRTNVPLLCSCHGSCPSPPQRCSVLLTSKPYLLPWLANRRAPCSIERRGEISIDCEIYYM